MKLKLINISIILILIIMSGIVFAQDQWLIKIESSGEKELIREDEVITFIENYSLFNSLFPNPVGFRMPASKEIFEFESNVSKNLKNKDTREVWINDYVNAKLFLIEAKKQNKNASKESDKVYNESSLDSKINQFEEYLGLKIPERVYLINVLLEDIDKPKKTYVDEFHSQLSNMPQLKQVPQNKIRELATDFAKEREAEETLEKEIKKIRGSKSITKDRYNPFSVKIDSKEEFSVKEVEDAFKGYLNLTVYIYMGGMGEEGYSELFKSNDTKEMFVDEYINYYLLKQKMKQEGKYDSKVVDNYIDRCLDYFEVNFINIKYTLKYILPEVQKKVTPDVLNEVINRLKGSPEYSSYIDLNTQGMDSDKKEEWIKQFAQRLLYQNLVLGLKEKEINRLRDAYKIETNF